MLYTQILSILFCENQTEHTYIACVKKKQSFCSLTWRYIY